MTTLTRSQLNRWTAALRENPHLQGKRYLQNNGKFCCLGMLCKLEGVPFTLERGIAVYNFGDYRSPRVLQGNMRASFNDSTDGNFKALGMPEMLDKRYDGSKDWHYHDSLAQANDCGASWAEIADHLDKYYPVSSED